MAKLGHMEHAETAEKSAGRKRAATQRIKDTPLTEADWIDAAIDILVDENVRGVRIDALCRRLGVTKGSFYWHFKGRTQLLASLLNRWRQNMTMNTIDRLSRDGDSPEKSLRALFELPRRPRSPGFARVEQSIRDWGRREDQAQEAVREVDELRLNYFRRLLMERGLDPDTADRRAYIAYAIMMGDSVLRVTLESDGEASGMIDEIMTMLTQDAPVSS